jgi:hypothetical protein
MAKDVQGKELMVGQKVARAVSLNRGGSTAVVVAIVTHINIVGSGTGHVYLDGSKQPMKFPERLAIIG